MSVGFYADILGTTRPSFKVQAIVGSGTATASAFIPTGSGLPVNGLFLPAANAVALATNTTERLRVDANGQVGIGVTPAAASGLLQVSGVGGADSSVRISNSTYGVNLRLAASIGVTNAAVIYTEGAHALRFGTNNAENMRLDSLGNVGVGAVPQSWSTLYKAIELGPSGAMTMWGAAGSAQVASNLYVNATPAFVRIGALATALYAQNAGIHLWYSDASGTAATALTPTERMRLDVAGNVGINSAAPDRRLIVTDGGTSGWVARITSFDSTNVANMGALEVVSAAATGSALDVGHWNTTSTAWALRAYGNVGRTSVGIGVQGSGGNFLFGVRADGFVGVGTSAPAYKLNVVGGGATAVISANSSDASGVGIYLQANSSVDVRVGTGFGVPLLFLTNATERMQINAAGNVGIGTTPKAWNASYDALEVGASGGAALMVGVNNSFLMTNTYYNAATAWVRTTANPVSIYEQTSGAHIWFSDVTGGAGSTYTPTERMRLDAAGNLGIGVTGPSYRLHVQGNSVLPAGWFNFGNTPGGASETLAVEVTGNASAGRGPVISFYAPNNPTSLSKVTAQIAGLTPGTQDTGGYLAFSTSATGAGTTPTERMRIDAAGKVGIGVSALVAGNLLTIGGGAVDGFIRTNTNAADIYIGSANVSYFGFAGNTVAIIAQDGSAKAFPLAVGTFGAQPLIFGTNSGERMRIDSAGLVGIGGTPAYKLHVIAPSSSALVMATSSDASGVGIYVQANSSVDVRVGTLNAVPMLLLTNSLERVRIDSVGNVGIGGISPSVQLHAKSAGGEQFRLETTVARGSGNTYMAWQDPTGRKAFLGFGASNDDFYINNNLAAGILLRTNNLQRMSIDSAGLVTIAGAATVGTTLGVTGAVTMSAAATVGTTLTVTGLVTMSAAATVGTTLTVTGAVTMSAAATVGTNLGIGTATVGAGGAKVLSMIFGTAPAAVAGIGQLYISATGQLMYRGPTTSTIVAPA